jgi:uncharacterized protein YjbI with pentapeptide repeats
VPGFFASFEETNFEDTNFEDTDFENADFESTDPESTEVLLSISGSTSTLPNCTFTEVRPRFGLSPTPDLLPHNTPH